LFFIGTMEIHELGIGQLSGKPIPHTTHNLTRIQAVSQRVSARAQLFAEKPLTL
jgi:hypothetical protein